MNSYKNMGYVRVFEGSFFTTRSSQGRQRDTATASGLFEASHIPSLKWVGHGITPQCLGFAQFLKVRDFDGAYHWICRVAAVQSLGLARFLSSMWAWR